jgi:hypothetical protein
MKNVQTPRGAVAPSDSFLHFHHFASVPYIPSADPLNIFDMSPSRSQLSDLIMEHLSRCQRHVGGVLPSI